jgi:hypothetical protein
MGDDLMVDITVGISTKNCADTIAKVMRAVDRGLEEFFPDRRSLIVVSDGFSTDGTQHIASRVETHAEKLVIEQGGGPGKGNGVRTVLRIAQSRQSKAVALVDGDLISIKPQWIKLLIQPILDGKDLVVPFYIRHRYDGVITNQLVFPLVSALFGVRIRQPIGGEYGLSAKLTERLLIHKLFPQDFGIDIFITLVGICEGAKIVEAALGVKEHESTKQYTNPEELLVPMFYQVIGELFELIYYYKGYIKEFTEVKRVKMVGKQLRERPAEIRVDKENLLKRFREGYEKIKTENKGELIKLKNKVNEGLECFSFPLELWVQAVYSAINSFKFKDSQVLDILRVLWQGRFLSFVLETETMSDEEAEAYIQGQLNAFVKYRRMLNL